MSPESQTPPPVHEADFEAVNITDEAEIRRRFNPFVRQLQAFLGQMPCLRDVPQTRRRWRPRAPESQVFENFVAHPREWYTFNCGGRTEAHFNVSLRPTYLAVGLGFEFTLNKGGDPTAVGLAYACFVNVIRTGRSQFESFVAENKLEIEWSDRLGGPLAFIPSDEVVRWLLNPPRQPVWIFVGRLLRRVQDASVLEDANVLGRVMQAVLCGFRPIWEQTQMMALACR